METKFEQIKNNFKHTRQLVFGHDIFISHRWNKHSKAYAQQLSKELENYGLDCFLDYNEVHAGKSIPVLIQLGIKRSKMFILVTTKDVTESKWIPKELKLANNGRRNIISINVENAIGTLNLEEEPWNILADRLFLDEARKSFKDGKPSNEVLRKIDESFTDRRNKTRATHFLFSLAVAVLLFTTIPAAYALYVKKLAQTQTQELEEKARQANTQLELTEGNLKTLQGLQQQTQASLEQTNADLANKNLELEQRNSELDTAKSDLGNTKNQLGAAQNDLEKKQTELDGIQTILRDKQKQLAEAEENIIKLGGIEPPMIIPYNPNFLGKISVPLPTVTSETAKGDVLEGRVFDYTHYSLVMDESRAMPIYTACNIDRSKLYRIPRRADEWRLDSRLDRDLQKGNGVYARNVYDRGHLVRRLDAMWGDSEEEANVAQQSVFFFPNSAPQYKDFNQQTWTKLEDFYLHQLNKDIYRLSVFTGPVSQPTDIEYRGSRIPQAFWKIIVFADPSNESNLLVYAYLMKQYEIDINGKPVFITEVSLDRDEQNKPQSDDENDADTIAQSWTFDEKAYRVPISEIEKRTSLDFGSLKQFDTLGK